MLDNKPQFWTVHEVTQNRKQDEFQGWNISLPGFPKMIGRSEIDKPMDEDTVFYLASLVLKASTPYQVTKLFSQKEDVMGYMITERGRPVAFVMKEIKEEKCKDE